MDRPFPPDIPPPGILVTETEDQLIRHGGASTTVSDTEPPGLRRAITPGAVLSAARRRWFITSVVGVTLAVAAAIGTWTLRPDKYTSFALLRVASSEQKILQETSHNRDTGVYARTQLALLRSRHVLRTALRDETVKQLPIVRNHASPIEWLEKELIAEQVQNTEVVRVALTTRAGGEDLATIVNAVVEAYMVEVVKGEHALQLAHLNDLQTVYSAAEEKLRQLRASVHSLTNNLKGGDAKILSHKQQIMLEEYSSLKRDLGVASSRSRELELKIGTYRLRLTPVEMGPFPKDEPPLVGVVDIALIEREVEVDSRVVAADAEIGKIREQIRQFETVSSSVSSSYKVELTKKLTAAESTALAIRNERRMAIVARQRALTDATARQQIREAEAERELLQTQIGKLQTDVGNLKKEIESLGINSTELDLQQKETERHESFLRTVWDQKARLEAELKGSARQRVTVLSKAEEAAVLNKNTRLMEAGGMGVTGFLLGILIVAVLDLRRNRIHTQSDVSRGLNLRVLAAVPKMSGGGNGLTKPSGKYGAGVIESFDGLRTALLAVPPARSSTGRCLALMVASSMPGEGKSTLAGQLAASFARTRQRTLLVDCDLRSPSLHNLFQVGHAPGVCEVLTGSVHFEDAIRPTGVEHLDFLPAGMLSDDVAAALGQQTAIHWLLGELRNRYEYIVIDSSPILLVPDALMIASSVDGLLVSVRPGVSQAGEVYSGYERLVDYRLPVLGVVVNGITPERAYVKHGYNKPVTPATV